MDWKFFGNSYRFDMSAAEGETEALTLQTRWHRPDSYTSRSGAEFDLTELVKLADDSLFVHFRLRDLSRILEDARRHCEVFGCFFSAPDFVPSALIYFREREIHFELYSQKPAFSRISDALAVFGAMTEPKFFSGQLVSALMTGVFKVGVDLQMKQELLAGSRPGFVSNPIRLSFYSGLEMPQNPNRQDMQDTSAVAE